MEIDSLKDSLIRYYKEHQSDYVQKVAIRYIQSQYDQMYYEQLLQAILKSHPFNYGFPDVAAIEEAHDKMYKRDGVSIRKPKPKSEWSQEEKPLTEEERQEAEANREKWNEMLKQAERHSNVKKDDKCQSCSHKAETGQNYYCRGCLGYSKYEEKTNVK